MEILWNVDFRVINGMLAIGEIFKPFADGYHSTHNSQAYIKTERGVHLFRHHLFLMGTLILFRQLDIMHEQTKKRSGLPIRDRKYLNRCTPLFDR